MSSRGAFLAEIMWRRVCSSISALLLMDRQPEGIFNRVHTASRNRSVNVLSSEIQMIWPLSRRYSITASP